MATGKIRAGTIVLNNYHTSGGLPLWGITLPHEYFARRLEGVVGQAWPAGFIIPKGEKSKEDFMRIWGCCMPTDPRDMVSTSNRDVEHRVLPSSALEDPESDSLGVWYLGGIWNHNARREVEFEVVQKSAHLAYPISVLPIIVSVRKSAFLEAGAQSRRFPQDQTLELEALRDYFSGAYLGTELSRIQYDKGSFVGKVVETLRESGLPEEGVVKHG